MRLATFVAGLILGRDHSLITVCVVIMTVLLVTDLIEIARGK